LQLDCQKFTQDETPAGRPEEALRQTHFQTQAQINFLLVCSDNDPNLKSPNTAQGELTDPDYWKFRLLGFSESNVMN